VQFYRLYRDTVMTRNAACRPSTEANKKSMTRAYLMYCIHFDIHPLNPTPLVITMYIQFLSRTLKSPIAITNYVSAISQLHKAMDLPSPTTNYRVSTMLRAVKIQSRHIPNKKSPINAKMLYQICDVCDLMGVTGLVLKSAYLMTFFTFVRQSNIAPTALSTLDITRHTTRADVIFSPPGLYLLLKWSKTFQTGEFTLLPVPEIQSHKHCPVQTYKKMCNIIPAEKTSPMFLYPSYKIVTISNLQTSLKYIVQLLGYDPIKFTMHSFRSGGATECHNASIPTDQIKKQGTWVSNCFWNYISSGYENESVTTALAEAFKK